LNLPPNFGIGNVEVWLMRIKGVIEVLSGYIVVLPVAALITWEYHVLVWVLGLFVKPYVILSVSGIAILPGRLEPGVVNRCVVQDEVNYHANTSLLCRVKKFNEVAKRTIARIYIEIIAYVVAIVAVRRWK